MTHIADAWKACDAYTLALAERYPAATFTSVRDIYGRCSIAIDGLPVELVDAIKAEVDSQGDIRPYLGTMGVQLLEEGSSLATVVHSLRSQMANCPNAFVVKRLLSNESWVRGIDSNPKDWPPVIAFYSFKGGVGRTTTTALTALTLAREGKRVVVIDLDLEAPGIEGYFFAPEDPNGKVQAGVVDYLLERAIFGEAYKPDMNDFVVPCSDQAIAATGGALVIIPAGRIDDTYMERLGRLNLAEIGRKAGLENPLRALIGDVLDWRAADVVLVDCRTGFTDLGGLTLNGLSTLDVLVFRGGEADRRYLPIVLENIQRFREASAPTHAVAERLARSFLIVYTMVELPPRTEDAEQYVAELRRYTAETCWKLIFERFANCGYAYPSDKSQDSPLEAVPHDVVLIPYLKDFFMVGAISAMLRIQAERPERPYDALVKRLIDVKLTSPSAQKAPAPSIPVMPPQLSIREQALNALIRITESPAGEREFTTLEDFRNRFLPRAAYRTLLDPKAFLVLGRKGAGKSALFQILTHGEVARALASHLSLDSRLIERTRWEVGFAVGEGFPARDDFSNALETTKEDLDLLANFWRSLAAYRLSLIFKRPLPELPDLDSCITRLRDTKAQSAVREWMEQLNSSLSEGDHVCCLSYDDLDTALPRDSRKRGLLVSALVEYWQQSVRHWPHIRAKLFLREDIWNREVVDVTDKAKLRDGIDRGTITWDGPDIYRTVLKRLGHDPSTRELLKQEGLWLPGFDAMLDAPLGFIPPDDEDWIRKCIHMLAGETMASGPSGYKKGYVYTWVLNHISDSAGLLRPRNALLLFSEVAKLQATPEASGELVSPKRFMEALRGSVSRQAVEDLRAEFKQEWSFDGQWLPDTFSSFEYVWPVAEDALASFLKKKLKMDAKLVTEKIEHMQDAGLLERRTWRGRPPQLQIPDIYLFGLNLTRKG